MLGGSKDFLPGMRPGEHGQHMRFDDRLATVLRQAPTGETVARIQFRQLIDLIDKQRGGSPTTDAAYGRLAELSEIIPLARRAAILSEPSQRLSNPQLIAWLSRSDRDVAAAALGSARLEEDEWLDLVPALPVGALGSVARRRDLGPRVDDMLARIGVRSVALPRPYGGPVELETTASAIAQQDEPLDLTVAFAESGFDSFAGGAPGTDVAPDPRPEITALPDRGDTIGAIVRRIEAFRKARPMPKADDPDVSDMAPRLPLGDLPATLSHGPLTAFDFATDSAGRIVWCDRRIAPMVLGLSLGARDRDGPLRASLTETIGRRQPLVAAPVEIVGAPAVEGHWRVDATPRFDRPGGGFVGYIGRMRRLLVDRPADEVAEPQDSEADRMRQVLHELRTPVNAIQGFAEIIQQQLFGPTPHGYRALAAAIASDGAHILAGFEELERLVKLDTGAMVLDPGRCDLGAVVEATIAQLGHYTGPRGSGFDLVVAGDYAALAAAMSQSDAEALVWRLLATLAAACAPGETIRMRLRRRDDSIRLSIRLPAGLADADTEALFETAVSPRAQALSSGAFGSGFALRLARAEARSIGGDLHHQGRKLRLVLPAFQVATSFNMAETNIVH